MADDACDVAAVLCAVGGVDLIVDIGGGFLDECDVFVDAANLDMALV